MTSEQQQEHIEHHHRSRASQEWIDREYEEPSWSNHVNTLCGRVERLTDSGRAHIQICRWHVSPPKTTVLAETTVDELTTDLRAAFETYVTPEMEGLQISIEPVDSNGN
jgi:hypothetical protein